MGVICAFCELSIGDDEITSTDDEGRIFHMICAEVEAEENEEYTEND